MPQTEKLRFTPGPWELEGSHVFRRHDHKGTFRLSIDVETFSAFRDEKDANVALVSSAPDLYFALKQILSDLPRKRDWLNPDLEILAKDAIAKAEGK
jgi:hypothetical protein